MFSWLRNVYVQVCIGAGLTTVICPWVDSFYPASHWWPVAWTAAFGVIGLVLVHWFAYRHPAKLDRLATALGWRRVD